jgi:hypothetical protein
VVAQSREEVDHRRGERRRAPYRTRHATDAYSRGAATFVRARNDSG